uniref:Heme oxygenase n=2 Tax=Gracilariopsis TaxID=2781 RepID=A0A1C9CET9_9FLOR|nr:heme oxygenase [Gracilariopsis lemaneiformis]YP_009294617.1 heme oxygenase [Gracilariopsis chorda]AJO68458.1 heme oxygenase [Gracilariopsis lemaneiformis]AML79832.1 heme oxygenase [Gracilariopsis lemaneiformis]AOM66877.1 heme oxygenase [Gracilariopsis chorda]AZB45805.1 heme oxygenase [Gracilariopsis lemaneiformis]
MSTNLAQQLREGTTKAHSMAENVSFVKSFLGGVVDKKSYRKLVANLFFVYNALEEEIEKNKNHSVIRFIYFPELNRKLSLSQDLQYYYGTNWEEKVSPSLATKIYIDRIRNISINQPELLIAHAYTRYMGDLSGGQILKKIAQTAMNLSGSDGVSFYNFQDIKDDKAFKAVYRQALDSAPIDSREISQIIAEANTAFNLNMKVFQELNSNFIKIMGMLLLSAVSSLRKKFT